MWQQLSHKNQTSILKRSNDCKAKRKASTTEAISQHARTTNKHLAYEKVHKSHQGGIAKGCRQEEPFGTPNIVPS